MDCGFWIMYDCVCEESGADERDGSCLTRDGRTAANGNPVRIVSKLFSAVVLGLAGAAGILLHLCRSALGIGRIRLTRDDLDRIAKGHTPLEAWPPVDEATFAPGTFPSDTPVPAQQNSVATP
jgi:hypothetical protein